MFNFIWHKILLEKEVAWPCKLLTLPTQIRSKNVFMLLHIIWLYCVFPFPSQKTNISWNFARLNGSVSCPDHISHKTLAKDQMLLDMIQMIWRQLIFTFTFPACHARVLKRWTSLSQTLLPLPPRVLCSSTPWAPPHRSCTPQFELNRIDPSMWTPTTPHDLWFQGEYWRGH